MSGEIYAVIKQGSQYAHQNPISDDGKVMAFPVQFVPDPAGYIVRGNGDRYRLSDVDLYCKAKNGLVKVS
ncbi:hypothetical protein [Kistimonas asteriae]|uniref:hypothetical protein n=1 Tax=Kistimonas asteriae TaxID=517724 RepID=UPI001BADB9FF|nr:hypothetical protein [Kistimonas asteriae]